jgi:hypothetical protein
MAVIETLDDALSPSADADEAVEVIVGLEASMRSDQAAYGRLQRALSEPVSAMVRVAVLDALWNLSGDARWRTELEDEAQAEPSTDDDVASTMARIAVRRIEHGKDMLEVDALWTEALPQEEMVASVARSAHADSLSVVIHGTWATNEEWWRPGGDFFDYLRRELRIADVYAGEKPFRWSGLNRDQDRRAAAQALFEWIRDHAKTKSLSIYAHSHGANVAMLATRLGLEINRLVMMSPPVRQDYFANWQHVRAPYNLQANRDAVVAIARGGRTFGLAHVKERELSANGHSSTHSPAVWRAEKVPRWLELVPA